MRHISFAQRLDDPHRGEEIFGLAAEIYPICRSITGAGVRETLASLAKHIDLKIHEVPTGTKVFDWTIPPEWTVRGAYIQNAAGGRVLDLADSNLHVVSYSRPINARMPLDELRKHIFTLPGQPELVPYRTSYYADSWGFCMSHKALSALPDGIYEAVMNSSLAEGSLTYGEYFHQGRTDEEFLLSAHICHPSLANDNCSGLALLTILAAHLAGLETHYSYRFVFAPGTIGSIAWLAINEHRAHLIRNGLVVSCLGDGGGPTYKRSRRGDAMIDRAMAHVLAHSGAPSEILEFSPYGYDERQYCSPGFNLGVGLFERSHFGEFPEYHTSADNMSFIRPAHLSSSYRMIVDALEIVENDWLPRNVFPKCEPQLGRRGLYSAIGGDPDAPAKSMAFLWVLNLADGRHSLLDIAERAKLPFGVVVGAARVLQDKALIVTDGQRSRWLEDAQSIRPSEEWPRLAVARRGGDNDSSRAVRVRKVEV